MRAFDAVAGIPSYLGLLAVERTSGRLGEWQENGPDRYPTPPLRAGVAWFDSTVGLAFGPIEFLIDDRERCALLLLSAIDRKSVV